MANVGTRLNCGTGTIANTTTIAGQGPYQEFWLIYSKSNVNVSTPTWLDASSYLRAFATSRGRDNELSEIEAGTATFTLDNRTRVFDPINDGTIRPRNRWKLYEQFSGSTNPVFSGYADSYDQTWPASGDAEAVVECSDEFGVLALAALPNMDPPSETYADLVSFDNPTNYWRWSDNSMSSTTTVETTEFPTFHWTYNGFEFDTVDTPHTVTGFQDWVIVTGVGFQSSFGSNPIAGDLQNILFTDALGGYLNMDAASGPAEIKANDISIGDPMGRMAFTFETWFMKSGNPGANTSFVQGPESTTGGVRTWFLYLTTTGTVAFQINDSGGTLQTVTSTTALVNNTWYHIVGEVDGANLRIFINGVQEATASSGTGSFRPTNAAGAPMRILGITGVTNIWLDETVVYFNAALPVARALAHYNGGALRGFRGGNSLGLAHLRAIGVLDAVSSMAPRNIRTSARGMQPVFQKGQDPLTELRKCPLVDMADGMLFMARDGTVTFLDAGHRSVSPWNTSQMTYTDTLAGGTNQYQINDGLATDFSLSFLMNEWNASRTGGTLTTSSDATSIASYGKRSQTLTDLPLTQDADVSTITAALLAKYKDPFYRITQIKPQMQDATTLDNTMQRELADKITITRTPPGGGSAVTQSSWVQKIEHSWDASVPFLETTLGVSPL